jgi:hypothetical protein
MNIVTIVLLVVAVYLVAGLIFGIAFISKGVTKIDEAAQGSGWGFRLIILPGSIVFWPVLLKKWMDAPKEKQHD